MVSNVISMPGNRQAPDQAGCLFCESVDQLVPFKDRLVCEQCFDEVALLLAGQSERDS